MLCDYAELEIRKQENELLHKKGCGLLFVHIGQFGRLKFCYLPTRHVSALPDLSKQEVVDLAEILSAVTVRYDNLFECSFPYSMGIHQAPLRIPDDESFR